MIERKFQNKKRYVLAFVIGTAIFLSVFFLSDFISYMESQRVSNLQTSLAYNIFSHKLDYSLFEKPICGHQSYSQITEDFNFQREIINSLELRLGKDSELVLERKKFYTLIELEHFEFVKKLNEECNQGIDIILFFYSNKKDDLEKSEDAGRILDIIYSEYSDNLRVYSFDINLNTRLIFNLKEKYDVDSSPTVIVNDKKIINPKTIAEIEQYLE